MLWYYNSISEGVDRMKKAKIEAIIDEQDGPTAVFSIDENNKKSKYKKIIFLICAFLVVSVLLINVIASLFFSLSLFKKDGSKDFTAYSYGQVASGKFEWVSENSEKIEFKNFDGVNLKALEIKNEHVSHSYIIICHRYGESPETMEEYAKHFYDLGFNIILPYMRGHGESPYDNISFGWNDRLDITEWVDYIVKNDKKSKIALFGVSLGANAVTLAASEALPENVRLVISDSCYTSLNDLVKEYIKSDTYFSSALATEIISVYSKNKFGVSLKAADTIEYVKNIELPIMFINGEEDEVVPPLVSKKLYENCNAKGVEEVIIENGAHGRNLQADKESYWANVDMFILNNIGI